MKHDAGVKIREGYLAVGYFHDFLVAINENDEFFIMEEPAHVYATGIYCDADAAFLPANILSQSDYEEFIRVFLEGGVNLYGIYCET